MAEHTPWQQGRTLMTAQTREWSADEWLKNDMQENRRIFAYFTDEDQGRGREFIAECRTVEHAEHIVECVNAFPDLLEALEEIASGRLAASNKQLVIDTHRSIARAAIKKASN